MTREERALRWIVGLLREEGIPFQVAGGLAARAYGASRPLVALDFYASTERLADIAAAAGEHLVWGPAHVREAGWDITFMKLDYEGQRIEVGGIDGVRIFDRAAGRWVEERVDLGASVEREVLGVVVPVMPLAALAATKRRLDREVDRLDLAEIASAG